MSIASARSVVPDLPPDAWTILVADTVSAFGTGLTLPFLLVYLHDVRGLSLALAGLALSAVAAGSVAGNLAGGALSDRIGARRALQLGLALAAAGAVFLTLIREPWQAFAATAAIGLGAGIIWPSQDALLATIVRSELRSRVFSVRFATMNAGLGAGALVAAVIVDRSAPESFVAIYVVDALSFVAALLVLARVKVAARAPAPVATPAPGYRAVLRDKVFLRIWALTALLVALSYGQMHAAFPAFATRPGGIGPDALAVAFAANTFTIVAAQLVVLRFMSGRLRTTALVIACGCWAASWALTLVAGGLGGGVGAVVSFALAMVVFGVAETFLSPALTPMVNDLAPADLTGRYNGLFTLAWTTGFLAGPAVAGIALGSEHGSLFLAALIAACALAALAAARLRAQVPVAANTVTA